MRAKREANRDLPLPIKEERENILLSIIHGGDITFHYSIPEIRHSIQRLISRHYNRKVLILLLIH